MQRYERKFVLKGIGAAEVEQMIRLHPAFFQTVYKDRWINNIYFDDVHRSLFFAHATGQAYRAKYRIRWYGKLSKKKPSRARAEIKYKTGRRGHKEIHSFKARNLGDMLRYPWPEHPKGPSASLRPVMYNRYRRSYFESFDRRFRLTLDQHLIFARPEDLLTCNLSTPPLQFPLIIELKYAAEHDDEAAQISSRFPFRLSKFSKYQTGMKYLYT